MHYLNPIVAPKYNQGRTIDEEFIYLSTPSATDITVQMNFPIGTGSPYVVVQDLDNLVTPPAPYYVSNGTLTLKNSRPIRIGFVNADKSVKLPGVTPTTIAMTLAGTVIPGTGEGLIFSSTSDFYVNYRARCSIQAGKMCIRDRWKTPTMLSYSIVFGSILLTYVFSLQPLTQYCAFIFI